MCVCDMNAYGQNSLVRQMIITHPLLALFVSKLDFVIREKDKYSRQKMRGVGIEK